MLRRYSDSPQSGYHPAGRDASFSLLRAAGRVAQGRKACGGEILPLPTVQRVCIWSRCGAEADNRRAARLEIVAQRQKAQAAPPLDTPLVSNLEYLAETVR